MVAMQKYGVCRFRDFQKDMPDVSRKMLSQTNTIPRLGIPPTVVADGPAGLRITPHRAGDDRDYFCTGFPVEILLASGA